MRFRKYIPSTTNRGAVNNATAVSARAGELRRCLHSTSQHLEQTHYTECDITKRELENVEYAHMGKQ
jgi:hypothetical protein